MKLRRHPRADRQHAARRRARSCRRTPTSGSGPSSKARTRAARRRTASRSKMIELAEARRRARSRAPRSSNRRRATPASGSRSSRKLRGYKLRVVMPENVSIERRQLLEIFGAEITLSPGEEGSNGAIRMAEKIARRRPDATCSSSSTATPRTRSRTTRAPVPRSARLPRGRRVRRRPRHERHADGRRAGTSRSSKPDVQVVAVEPPAGELVQGLRNLDDGFVPPIFDPDGARPEADRAPARVDRVDAPAARRVRRVRRHLVGRGGGGRGRRPPQQMDAGTIVTLLPDGGWKYLSSGAWTDRPRRGRRARHAHQLLVTDAEPTRSRAPSRCCAPAAWSRSRPRRCTGSAPTRRTADAVQPPVRGEGPAGRPSR